MCLAIPARVMALNGEYACVETDFQQLQVGRSLVPELDVGDWVLMHTGQIVTRLAPEEAAAARELIHELQGLERGTAKNKPSA